MPITELAIRENLSLANAVVLTCLALVFLRIVWTQARDEGWRSIWADKISQGAIALLVMTTGSAIYRVWIWAVLKAANDGVPLWFAAQWTVVLLSSVMAVGGALCAIRVFAPDDRGPTAWLATAAVTAAAVAINMIF
jgi:hypothetical protein